MYVHVTSYQLFIPKGVSFFVLKDCRARLSKNNYKVRVKEGPKRKYRVEPRCYGRKVVASAPQFPAPKPLTQLRLLTIPPALPASFFSSPYSLYSNLANSPHRYPYLRKKLDLVSQPPLIHSSLDRSDIRSEQQQPPPHLLFSVSRSGPPEHHTRYETDRYLNTHQYAPRLVLDPLDPIHRVHSSSK